MRPFLIIKYDSICRLVNIGRIVFVLFLIMCSGGSLFAQQAKQKVKGIKINKININFEQDGNGFNYLKLEDGTAAQRPVKKEQNFSLIDNYANINFRWKNPLKYTYTWEDSVYADEQQSAMKDFFKLLTPVFNIPEADAAKNNSPSIDNAVAKIVGVTDPLVKPTGGFKDYDLTILYVQLILAQSQLTSTERIALNNFTPDLKTLENGDIDYQPKAKNALKELFDVTEPGRVTLSDKSGVADVVGDNVTAWLKAIDDNQRLHDRLVGDLAKIRFSDELLNSLLQTGVSKYLDKSQTLNKANKTIVNKLTPLIVILKNSVPKNTKVFAYGDIPDMVKIRSIDLEEGKVLQTQLVITEYKISEEGLNLEKLSESDHVKLIFRGYDPLTFTVSTGIFFGTTNIRGFGTTLSGNDMLVTEDTLKQNAAIAAVFGNINFGIGSKLISPVVQLGVDPFKRHPFFLLGGGLAFPVVNFAITAGGIWTTEPTLQKLKKGDKIESTTKLEGDIKNNFQARPKGWYLGIQYNF